MAEPLVIVGAGGFGRETTDVVEAINAVAGTVWDLVGVYDDSPAEINLHRLKDRGVRYLGVIPTQANGAKLHYVVGIGHPMTRQRVAHHLEDLGWSAARLIHPAATVGTRSQIDSGVVVCGGAQISTNVRLGHHVHVNPNSTIGHDSQLDDYVSVNPAATVSGEVNIGERTLIGAGAVVLQGLQIGPDVVVGASACVTENIRGGVVVKGIPARE